MNAFTLFQICIVTSSLISLCVMAFIPDLFPPFGPYTVLDLNEELRSSIRLTKNDVLDGAERLLEGRISGPEGLASRGDGELYFGVVGGDVMRLSGERMDRLEKVVSMGSTVDNSWEEAKAGRPLGMRFGKDGKLLVADAYLGIFKVDVDLGTKELILSSSVSGSHNKFINDVTEDSTGSLYWSESSTIADKARMALESLAGPSGRLMKRDGNTGEISTLIDSLMFANGVQLSPNEDFILVAELFTSKIHRFWLKGPKAGTSDVFIAGLPGYPDNIRSRPEGGYDVPLVSVRHPKIIDWFTALNYLPSVRRVMAIVLCDLRRHLDSFTRLFPNDFTAKLSHSVMNFNGNLRHMTGNSSMVLQLDDNGQVTSNLNGNTGTVMFISEVQRLGDYLYIGSCCTDYLARISNEELQRRIKKAQMLQNEKQTDTKTEL